MQLARTNWRLRSLNRRTRNASRIVVFLVCLFAFHQLALRGAPVAHAQSAAFRSVDKNSDLLLSFSELARAFGRAGALRMMRDMDYNGDRLLSIPELRRGPGANRGDSDDVRGGDDDDDSDSESGRGDDDDSEDDSSGGDDSGGGGDD